MGIPVNAACVERIDVKAIVISINSVKLIPENDADYALLTAWCEKAVRIDGFAYSVDTSQTENIIITFEEHRKEK
jgi:hypothetical protein